MKRYHIYFYVDEYWKNQNTDSLSYALDHKNKNNSVYATYGHDSNIHVAIMNKKW